MKRAAHRHRPRRGFTLVELVMVMVVLGIIAATLMVFFVPAMQGWLGLRRRADLTDQAVTALNTMQRDVRLAVPNSIRLPNASCFELVPTTEGGRYRIADDGSGASKPLDLSAGTSLDFDILTSLSSDPTGSYAVIDNQNPGDVYAQTNLRQVTKYLSSGVSTGVARLTIASAFNDPGYQSGRFVIVPSTGPVFYSCVGAGTDSSGTGTGTVYRTTGYGFNAAYPSSCPATGVVLATHVSSCAFVYSPNAGATQQSGFVSMNLTLQRDGEAVSLVMGAHVANVP
jgi:MSHA biogenesis protein MshO